jgi:hypothetical protein
VPGYVISFSVLGRGYVCFLLHLSVVIDATRLALFLLDMQFSSVNFEFLKCDHGCLFL